MSARVFTPWWCLLTGTIDIKQRLHILHSGVSINPTCTYCNNTPKDIFYFIVNCPVKWKFWSCFLGEVNLIAQFPSSVPIWSALVTFTQYGTRSTLCR
ncbi:hypothetical protein K501DRAFT_187355 [Backusella circina FSU 941]|nr:hypothetical protein K501DRAFT_187355 [Backusella circina FSU 941]